MGTDAQLLMVPTADGRELEVLVSGPVDGLPLVFHTGTPSGPVPYEPTTRAAAENGLRLVTYGRPGYGRSTPQPGRSVADVVADTVTVLDHLGAAGVPHRHELGGGPHALACAALLPHRCLAAASVAGVAPWDAEALDVMAGMGPENLEEFGLAMKGAEALTTYLETVGEPLRTIEPKGVVEAFGGLVPDVDKAVLTGTVAAYYAEEFHKALEHGIAGWRDDDLAFVRPWGFDLTEITVPVSVWQGEQDLMVPFAHGQWLAAHVPGATVHLYAEHGHLSLTEDHVHAILADLAATARAIA